ncbi:MAG: cupin-like domain-containing protein [Sphingomonadales bacterium]
MTAFPDPAEFAILYPETPGVVRHTLAEHPLFELGALVELARTLDPKHVEYNRGNLPTGIDPGEIPANGLSIADTIRSIEENGSWMVLKFVEQNAAYRALLTGTLGELAPVIDPVTGVMHQLESFIFISSPNSVTPLHFDPEHNILLQLRGTKTMTVFPSTDAEIAPNELHERFQLGLASRNLPWNDAYAARGTAFTLNAGDGMHVPVMTPHWVKNGPDVSVSFSVTWRSEWSYRAADAHAFNAVLRKTGLTPARPGRYPVQNVVKAFAWRAMRKMRL